MNIYYSMPETPILSLECQLTIEIRKLLDTWINFATLTCNIVTRALNT